MSAGGLIGEISRRLSEAGSDRWEDVVCERMEGYIEEIARWGERVHLVGRGNLEENICRQVVESTLLLEYSEGITEDGMRSGNIYRVADVGTGAGFPGVVWKILEPAIEITLFEKKRKKQIFLERFIAGRGIGGIRVEGIELTAGYGERFGLVVSKAAGELGKMLPLAGSILNGGGWYITLKGGGWKEEIRDMEFGGFDLRDRRALATGRGIMLAFKKKN